MPEPVRLMEPRPLMHPISAAYRAITSPVRLMPDFLIIGTQRGGTTSLYHYLTQHPYVATASVKEVHFYDKNFRKGMWWYRAHFPTSLERQFTKSMRQQPFVTGEASPYYLIHPLAPKRVAQTLPHIKLIALLRNPVDRAYSHYLLQRWSDTESLSFADAIAREQDRIAEESARIAQDPAYNSHGHQHYSYLARGLYAEQLQRWLEFFPRDQFLILKSEDLYEDPLAVLKETLAFLDVPSTGTLRKDDYTQMNHMPRVDGGLDPELRKHLSAYFAPHNARLYELLGRDFGWD